MSHIPARSASECSSRSSPRRTGTRLRFVPVESDRFKRFILRSHLAWRPPKSPCALLTTVLILLTGCENGNWSQWGRPVEKAPLPKTQPATDVAERSTPLTGMVVIQTVQFAILRVRAPAGTFSDSEKLWNPVNEEVLPAPTQLLLRNNGLRIGVGKQASWPQIKAALDAEKVEVSQDAQVMQNGVPLSIELNGQPRDQTLFLIRSDGTMPGASFPQSTNALRVEYWIPPNASTSVMMELIPEIQMARALGQSALAVAALRNPTAAAPSRLFRELAARIPVGPDEFLVIGPSAAARQNRLIGSLMLGEEIDGRQLESMCYITPRILSAAQSLTP
jgi:hypothetical protein